MSSAPDITSPDYINIADAIAYVDDYTNKQNAKLGKSLASTEARKKSSSIGQVDGNNAAPVKAGATNDLSDTPLSNVSPDMVSGAVGTLTDQMGNSSTGKLSQTPNSMTSSSFSSLTATDSISGSDSSALTRSGGGTLGRTNPLIGGSSSGSLTSVTSGISGGIVGLLQQQAMAKLEAVVAAKIGFNIRTVVTDVQNGAITMATVAMTAKTDIAMELIATNARSILKELPKKDAIADQLIAEFTVLHNLVTIILGNQPDFKKYLADLIRAYNAMVSADADLKSVVRKLTTTQKYDSTLYARANSNLVVARDLILPKGKAPPARLTEFLTAYIGANPTKDGLAAALALPGVLKKVADLMLLYSKEVVVINGLLLLYMKALNSAISSFKASPNVNQATIDHLNAGIAQLDALLADMKAELFPTDGRDKKGIYPAEVTTAAAGWGVRLTTIIQFLNTNPSVGSAILNLTTTNVDKYNQSVAALKKLNDRKYGLSTLKVNQSQENVVDTVKQMGRLLVTASLSVVPNKSATEITAEFKQINDLLLSSKMLSGDIRRALDPFANAQSALSKDIAAVTGSILKVFQDLGMNRATDLLKNADFTSFFKMTPATATYVGAASFGIGLLLKKVATSTSTTDQDYGKLSEMKTNFDRSADVNMTESSRSYAAQETLFSAQINEAISSQSALATSIKGIASRYDDNPTPAEDPTAIAADYAGKAVGSKFSFGAA